MAVKREKPNDSVTATITSIAEEFGVARSVVNRALETGELPPAGLGKDTRGRRTVLDPEAFREALRAFLASPPKLGRPPKEKSPAVIPEGVDVEDPSTWPLDLAVLEMIREWWIARAAKRKDDLASGELVRAEDVRRKLFAAARMVRDALTAIPGAAADDLAAELGADASAVRNLLQGSIDRALSDLSAALEQVAGAPPDEEAA